MDEKIKTWLLRFPAKETLIWRRHSSIGQSCCSMTSKRSIGCFLESSREWRFFTRVFRFPPSQATARLASFADIFSIWPRFLPFSPTAEPGPGLMTVTLWHLRKYLWKTKSKLRVSNTSYQSLQTTKLNFENLLGQQVFQNHNKNLFQSSTSLSKLSKYS